MKKIFKETKVRNTTVYIVLRFLIIVTIVLQSLKGNFDNVFVCVLALLLFTLPNIVSKRFKIELPTMLESIIYAFIFSAQILGEIQNFYFIFPYWDVILHTLNGFICAGIGFSLFDLLNKNQTTKIYLSPIYITIVAVLFSVTVGCVWEFFEYNIDKYMLKDTQKDEIITDLYTVNFNLENEVESFNDITKTEITYDSGKVVVIDNGYLDIGLHDTMHDMYVNLIGALIFALFGYYYAKDSDEYEFAKNFIPKMK